MSSWGFRVLALLGLAGGCKSEPQAATLEPAVVADQAVPAPAAPEPLSLARVPALPDFEPPGPWRSRRAGTPPVAPPKLDAETWRVLVERNRPLQRETPHWQDAPARVAVALDMPAPTRFRCLVTPARVTSAADDAELELRGWKITRELRCSQDGFETWTTHPHRVFLGLDRRREVELKTEAFLRERQPDGTLHELHVILRDDREQRAARLGPPQQIEHPRGPDAD